MKEPSANCNSDKQPQPSKIATGRASERSKPEVVVSTESGGVDIQHKQLLRRTSKSRPLPAVHSDCRIVTKWIPAEHIFPCQIYKLLYGAWGNEELL